MPKKKPKKGGLSNDQKDFIKSRVKDLGTLKGVKEFYHKDDTVSEYANKMAKELKLPEEELSSP